MGPRSDERGRITIKKVNVFGPLLQWGRADQRGRWSSSARIRESRGKLQWGRALMSAEGLTICGEHDTGLGRFNGAAR